MQFKNHIRLSTIHICHNRITYNTPRTTSYSVAHTNTQTWVPILYIHNLNIMLHTTQASASHTQTSILHKNIHFTTTQASSSHTQYGHLHHSHMIIHHTHKSIHLSHTSVHLKYIQHTQPSIYATYHMTIHLTHNMSTNLSHTHNPKNTFFTHMNIHLTHTK